MAISCLPDELVPKRNFIERKMGTAGNSYTNLLNVENAIPLVMVILGRTDRFNCSRLLQ
jgi:hypothetical protein